MSEFLRDGFTTFYTFSDFPSILVKEIETTPVGTDGGGGIDQVTMRNSAWRTTAPKALKSLTAGKTSVAYDPAVLEDIFSMTNHNQLITLTYPDDDTVAFWGFMDKFQPSGHKEGDRPTADMEIIPSMLDDDWVETPPDYTAA